MEKARRPQVPAFGEWNYCYHHYGKPPAAERYYSPEPEACGDVWFRYSPPRPRKPTPKKTRRSEGEKGSGGRERASEAAVGFARPTAVKARGASASRVVRPVDEDLYYQVLQPEFVSCRRPGQKSRSLLMGCFGGLNSCVA